MSETSTQTNVTTNNPSNIEISDAKFNEFFEKSGNVDFAETQEAEQKASLENKGQDKTPDTKQVDQNTKPEQEKDFDRNYKAAMHEERERRKEIQKELENQRKLAEDAIQRTKRIEDTWQQLVQRANQPQPPNFDEDPLGALQFENQRIKQELENQKKYNEDRAQYEQQQQQFNNFKNDYLQICNEFAKQNSDFWDAYNYVDQNRRSELQLARYNQKDINRLVYEDELAIVANAINNGHNPAEVIYSIAKARGYQAKQTVQKNNEQKTQEDTAKHNEQKLENIAKGMQESKSLSNTTGQTPTGDFTIDQLSKMTDDELNEFLASDNNWKKVSKLMK